ncbi:hypothetical protein F4803DRAFT_174650 [Xylaria telfairii]|nr:hypothetical protein F4803DRAFT_174650 [Xylaria telfairii]
MYVQYTTPGPLYSTVQYCAAAASLISFSYAASVPPFSLLLLSSSPTTPLIHPRGYLSPPTWSFCLTSGIETSSRWRLLVVVSCPVVVSRGPNLFSPLGICSLPRSFPATLTAIDGEPAASSQTQTRTQNQNQTLNCNKTSRSVGASVISTCFYLQHPCDADYRLPIEFKPSRLSPVRTYRLSPSTRETVFPGCRRSLVPQISLIPHTTTLASLERSLSTNSSSSDRCSVIRPQISIPPECQLPG